MMMVSLVYRESDFCLVSTFESEQKFGTNIDDSYTHVGRQTSTLCKKGQDM